MLEDYYRSDIYGWGPCSPVHPTGVMLIPGTVDQNPHSTYEGLSYGDMPLYMSVDDITSYWSNYNNTDFDPIITNVEDSAPNDGSTVERKRWLNGDNCSSVQELKVIGGDHDWPGSFGNMDINATQEIWNFVSKFDTNGLIDCGFDSSIQDLNFTEKKIVKIIDFLGREIFNYSAIPVLFIYDDGSVEKNFKL